MGRSTRLFLLWECQYTLKSADSSQEMELFSDYTLQLKPIADPVPAAGNAQPAPWHSWLFIVEGRVCCVPFLSRRGSFPCCQAAEVPQPCSRVQCCSASVAFSQAWHLASPWWFSGFCKVSLSFYNIVLEGKINFATKTVRQINL